MRTIAIAFAAMLLTAPPVVAQDADISAGLEEVLRSADRGDDYIRVVVGDRSIEGRTRRIEADSIWLGGGGADMSEIVRVEQREESGGGAMIGAIAGGVGLTVLLLPLAGLCEMDCDYAVLQVALVGGLLGGTLGGMIGALIAPSEKTWTTLWQAP